jgi:hypothetical protein
MRPDGGALDELVGLYMDKGWSLSRLLQLCDKSSFTT